MPCAMLLSARKTRPVEKDCAPQFQLKLYNFSDCWRFPTGFHLFLIIFFFISILLFGELSMLLADTGIESGNFMNDYLNICLL